MEFEIFIQDGLLGPEHETIEAENDREYKVAQLRALGRLGKSYDAYVRKLWSQYPDVMSGLFADQNQAVNFVKNNRKQLRV